MRQPDNLCLSLCVPSLLLISSPPGETQRQAHGQRTMQEEEEAGKGVGEGLKGKGGGSRDGKGPKWGFVFWACVRVLT